MEKQLRNTLCGLQKIQLFFMLPTLLAVIVSAIFLWRTPDRASIMEFLNYCIIFLSLALPFAAYRKLRCSESLPPGRILRYALGASLTGAVLTGLVIYLGTPEKSLSITEAYSILPLNIAFIIYLLRFFFVRT